MKCWESSETRFGKVWRVDWAEKNAETAKTLFGLFRVLGALGGFSTGNLWMDVPWGAAPYKAIVLCRFRIQHEVAVPVAVAVDCA